MEREPIYKPLSGRPDCELLEEITGELPHEDVFVIATSYTSVDGQRNFLSREFPDGCTTRHEVE